MLLQCADSLNEDLKLAALRGLAQLLSAAFAPAPEQRRRRSPAQEAAEQAAASACAAQTLGELSTQEGAVVLLRLARDTSLRVRAAALGLLAALCADEASAESVEAARAVPLLVALCSTATETPPDATIRDTSTITSPSGGVGGHHPESGHAGHDASSATKASLPSSLGVGVTSASSSGGPADQHGGDGNAAGSEVDPSSDGLATIGNAAAAAAAAAPRRRLAAASLAVFSLASNKPGGTGAAEAKAAGLAEARQRAAAQAHCVELAVCCLPLPPSPLPLPLTRRTASSWRCAASRS